VQKNKPDYYNDLDKIYFKIWKLLDLGLQNSNAPFHIPVFVCGNKNEFDGRIVVLRGIDKVEKKIWFHSDIRSGKVKILKANSEGSLLFYDKSEKVQQCYLGDKAPGSDFSTPTSVLSGDVDHFKYSIEESEIGYKNFCVVETNIKSMEWLYLAAKGHRRAYFSLKNNSLEKKWLIP